jgi:TIR domain
MGEGNRSGQSPVHMVVIYAKEDRELASTLVRYLRSWGLDVWWAEEDLTQGQWDAEVRKRIEHCDALVPLVSAHTGSHQIFTDEWSHAEARDRPIFPIVFDKSGIPFGKGRFSYTLASDYSSEARAFDTLKAKLVKHFEQKRRTDRIRPREIAVGEKTIPLPNFVFSLSSFETQIHPLDGLELLSSLPEAACLVSAFDVHASLSSFKTNMRSIAESPKRLILLDSGNYEATRKRAYADRERKQGWKAQHFWEVAASAPWDLVFSYDHPPPQGSVGQVVDAVLDSYFRDMVQTGLSHRVLCPIVHAISGDRTTQHRADTAELVRKVAEAIQPTLVAIPERELGDGLLARMRTVRAIRTALDSLPWYQPLHILGTGNPTTIAALALCGADTFDGLEWCRTAANYENNSLMHFQQFDLLKSAFVGRMTSEVARRMVEFEGAPFALRAASYNFDYFSNWLLLVRKSSHSGNPESIFQGIPFVGTDLSREYLNGIAGAY